MEKQNAQYVILSLGTNTCHAANMSLAAVRLRRTVGGMRCSRRLWTEPVALPDNAQFPPGTLFLNMLVAGWVNLTHDELHTLLKQIERECGRNDADKARGIIRIDIDILKYGDTISHADDWQRDYVKTLINDVTSPPSPSSRPAPELPPCGSSAASEPSES